jgi:hypothetical protein
MPSDRGVSVKLIAGVPYRADGEDHHLAYPLVE